MEQRKRSELKITSNSFIPKGLHNNCNNTPISNKNLFNENSIPQIQRNSERNKFDFNNINNLDPNNNDNNYNIFNMNLNTFDFPISDNNNINHLIENKSIYISLETNVKNTISNIIQYFQNPKNETIYLIGLNQAISKVILIAEIVKTKIFNLHQINNMDILITDNSNKINKEEDEGDIKRTPKFEIILSKIEPLEKGSGYQKPLTEEEIKILHEQYFKKTPMEIKQIYKKRKLNMNKNSITNEYKNLRSIRRKKILCIRERRNLRKIK
jgi:hypothetical protein